MSDIRYVNELGDALDVAIRTPVAARRRSRGGLVAAAGAFLVVLLAGSVVWMVRAPQEAAAPLTTTSYATTESVSLPTEWGRVPHQEVFAGDRSFALTEVAYGRGGYLAIGIEVGDDAQRGPTSFGPGYRSVMLSSADGITWERPTVTVNSDSSILHDVAIGPTRTAVAGLDQDGNVMFWSSSDGSRFVASSVEGVNTSAVTLVNSMIAADGGFVAVGSRLVEGERDASQMGVVWFSDSGDTWVEVADPLFNSASMNEVAFMDGVVYIAGVLETGPGQSDAAVWTSQDTGATWSLTVLARTEPEGFAGASGIIATEQGLVAVGFEGARGAVWFSEDGLKWTTQEQPAGLFDTAQTQTRLYDVVATDAGFVISGAESRFSDLRRITWISKDGAFWTRLDLDEPHVIEGSSAVAFDLATDGSTVVAVGSESTIEGNSVGAVWTSPPPPGVAPSVPIDVAPIPDPGESTVAISPSIGVSVTEIEATMRSEPGEVTIVLIGPDGDRYERCTAKIRIRVGRCTFQVGDLPPGEYTVTMNGTNVTDEPILDVQPKGSIVIVLGVTYMPTQWPLVISVSVRNHGAQAVDVSGWSIQETESDRFTFPSDTIIESGESVMVLQEDSQSVVRCSESGESYFFVCLDGPNPEGWFGAPLRLLDMDEIVIATWRS